MSNIVGTRIIPVLNSDEVKEWPLKIENEDMRELLESRLNLMSRVYVWPRKLIWVTALAKVVYLIIFLGLTFLNVSGAVVNFSKNIQTAIINAVEIGCCFSALLKILYVTMFPNKFYKFIEALNEVEFPPKEDPLYVHLEKKIKFNNLLVIAFKYTAFAAMVSQAFPGLYVTCFGKGRMLPINTYLDPNDLPLSLFWLISVLQFCVGLCLGVQICCFNGTVFAFISFAVAKLRMLKIHLYDLNNLIDHSKLTVGAHDHEVKEGLKQSIREQIIVNNLVNAIQSAFSFPILGEVVVDLILVALALISIVLTLFPSTDFFLNLCFLFSFMVNNAGFCFYGNELQVESEELWKAQYLLDWHYFGKSNRKTLFIMMERTLKPLQITIGPFAVLNHETFLAICNTAFSYFTIILNVYSNSDNF